jgi:bifunctional non-homologous end joining protein LigD
MAKERLARYRDKRDFAKTPEPSGEAPATAASAASVHDGAGLRFVIQRHRARRLHYDFRLEADGVLLSWAVPKGLTLDPDARHLAIHVEDHPLDYFDFEGVIPKAEYGGGTVIVWDQGTYSLDKGADAVSAVDDGELHLDLSGEKLRGRFVLVRTSTDRSGKEQWLVLHKRDEHAVAGWDPEDHPESVISGRTEEQVAADPERRWTSAGEERLRAPVPEFEGPSTEELEALDRLGAKGTWVFQSRELHLTNLDKVLFPARNEEPRVTKRDLVRYHACIAPVMLRYLLDRPLNLHRYPDGATRKGFWQKETPKYAPEWIPRWVNEAADEGESVHYLVADSPPALAWLANHAALELHAWTSRIPAVEQPTYALIDLDPGEQTSWDELLVLARLHRTALEHLGVRGFPKVTGRRGIQVWIPITPGPSFADTRAWVEEVSRAVGNTVPELVSWRWEKAARGGLARLDYTQNAINKTLVAPYSVRPAAGAPVSVPITWDELDDPALRPDRWTVRTLPERLTAVGDPMREMLHVRQALPALE